MKVCVRCVLTDTFPGISFNEDGVCSFCLQHEKKKGEREELERARKRLMEIVEEVRGKRGYHCLHALSGGKDSTYTLHLLIKKFRMNVLALTFDNGFISPSAMDNIKRVSMNLSFDHIVFRPDTDLLLRIFGLCSERDIFPPKTLQRASSICTACVGLIKGIMIKTAIEKGIPLISFGWSPGQSSRVASLFKMNGQLIRAFQNPILEPLRREIGDEVERFFLLDTPLKEEDFPYHISPLSFEDYDENRMIEVIEGYGWQRPEDTDPNSTNCLLNSYANFIHKERFGYNPYSMELSVLVREGLMKREEAMKRLETCGDPGLISSIEKKLKRN